MFPGPLATNAYQGKYYGVPLDTNNTTVMIYNPKIIATPPTTMDELKADAIAAKGTNKWGLGLGGDGSWNLFPWIWTLGGQITNADYTKASGYLDSPQTIAALQWLIDLKNAGGLGPSRPRAASPIPGVASRAATTAWSTMVRGSSLPSGRRWARSPPSCRRDPAARSASWAARTS